jgi:hypothetical protein
MKIQSMEVPMKARENLIRWLLFFTVGFGPHSWGDQVVLQPDPTDGKDTYVSSQFPTTTYCTSINMRVGHSAAPETARTFIQFDLSTIPSGSTVNSATLEVYGGFVFGTSSPIIQARQVTSPWSECTVDWNNQPSFSSNIIASDSDPVGSTNWWSWDVTSLVQNWMSGTATNDGFALVSDDESAVRGVWFYTSDDTADAFLKPKLTVNFTDIVLQPSPTAGKDTYVSSQFLTNIYCTSVNMRAGHSAAPETARSFIQFDLSAIPAESIVISAMLEVYGGFVFGTSSPIIQVRPITNSWSESTANWNNQPSFSSQIIASNSKPVGSTNWWSWDVTSLVQTWMSGTATNDGFALVSDDESAVRGVWFYTSDDTADASLRPKLAVDFITPPIISSPRLIGDTFTLSISTQIGHNYILKFKNSVNDASWTPLQTNSGNGAQMTLTNTGAVGLSRFYCVAVQ